MRDTLLLSFSMLALGLGGCSFPSYTGAPENTVELPQKLGLTSNNFTIDQPKITQESTQQPPDALTPPPKPSYEPATVQAKFAIFEIQPKDSSESATFKAQLFPQIAPRTVANFEQKANNKLYDGLTFHRVEDWVVQGGDPKGDGTGGGVMRTELNKQSFVAGALGMARGNDINFTNDSQFFIILRQVYGLDEQYTNFGQIIEGGDAVSRIKKGYVIKSIRVY